MPALALQLYVFFIIFTFCYIFYPSSYIFFIYYTKVLPYYGCTFTSPRSFAYRIGLGNVRGLVRGRGTSGSEMIFKRIKFIIFINIIVKVFNI